METNNNVNTTEIVETIGGAYEKDPVKEEMIDEILSEFDFAQIKKVMDFLEWKWASSKSEKKIPSIYEIVKIAKKVLRDVAYNDYNYVGTGGFIARKDTFDDGNFRLQLVFGIEYWDCDSQDISLNTKDEK